jgi:hypothetical protein
MDFETTEKIGLVIAVDLAEPPRVLGVPRSASVRSSVMPRPLFQTL